MPFYRVTSHTLLVEAENPAAAAMKAYRMFEDGTPTDFQVVGPDTEINEIQLTSEQQEQAITIAFAPPSAP
ncbi:hypothetical protein [Rhizobium leguminosarum]|uniref:hypothetical protein n=1 Tax=Rhizobium leguminosarum TaxID=384 RepID=UPI00143F8D79|nr:hypothetical protein [Rhizobium leguminosarum]NKL23689.1 hypothetical protein [Rhizobium leguminosarum bv. viciae]